MRKLGIVGGVSWNSTALYYDHINRGVARALERRREVATRLAIGASRRRILMQLLLEGLTLAVLAGVVSTPLTSMLTRTLAHEMDHLRDGKGERNHRDPAEGDEGTGPAVDDENRVAREMGFTTIRRNYAVAEPDPDAEELVNEAWKYFREVQTKDRKYQPLISPEDQPPIWMNKRTMDTYREQMRKYYYDPSKYKSYLEQLGIKYPTTR